VQGTKKLPKFFVCPYMDGRACGLPVLEKKVENHDGLMEWKDLD